MNDRLNRRKTLSLSLLGVLVGFLFLLSACDFVPASNPVVEPTPNLQATVEAMVNQRLEAIEQKSLFEVAVERQMVVVRATPTPSPTATPQPSPMPEPTPTATPIPTPTMVPTKTASPSPTVTPVPNNWIDKYQHQYGTLPQYPDWLIPLFPGRQGETISKAHTMSYVPNVRLWCNDMSPSERRMLLEFYEWRGEQAWDLVSAMARLGPPPSRSADYYLLHCPPKGGLP